MVAEQMADDADLLTTNETAAILCVSRATVLRMVAAGTLAPAEARNPQLGRPAAYRFRRADVEYLRDHPQPRTRKGGSDE